MRPRNARGSLSPKTIASAALAVADRDGLAKITIRAVARELKAAPMSLYSHVANKEGLFDLMFEELVERLVEFAPQPDWRRELVEGCRHARTILTAHPEWVPLLGRVAVPPMTLDLYERLLESMAIDGFDAEATMLAVSAAMSFTVGVVLAERVLHDEDGPTPLQQLRVAEVLLPPIAIGDHPRLREALTTFRHWSFDRVFEHGLVALVDGVEPRRANDTRT